MGFDSTKDYTGLRKVMLGYTGTLAVIFVGIGTATVWEYNITTKDVVSTVHKIDHCAQSLTNPKMNCDF